MAALFRLKAADFPDQGGHFPEQQRLKLLGSAVLGWKFRPNAARDIGHGGQTRTSVLRPQSRIIGRNSCRASHTSVSRFSRVGENPRSAESISPESMLIGHADPTISAS